jgi:hypothetical protein
MDDDVRRGGVQAKIVQDARGRCARLAPDPGDQAAVAHRKAQVLDQAQVALDLMEPIWRTQQLGRQRAAAELFRLASAQRNPGQVAHVAGDVRRLAKRGEDERRVEAARRQFGDLRLLARRVERDVPAHVLPHRTPHHHVVDPRQQRRRRRPARRP